jgi:hypothetical protein
MTDLYKEEPTQQQPLYTEEDMQPVKSTGVDNYPIVKSVAVAATGNPEQPDEVNFDSFVDNVWRTTVPNSNELDRSVAVNAATNGNVSVLQEALNTIGARNALYGAQSANNANIVRAKLKELSDQAVENVAVKNPAVLFNNTADEISNATDRISSRITSQAVLEKAVVDGKSIYNIGKGFGYEFTPMAAEQGAAIDRVAVKYGVPEESISRTEGRSLTKTYLQAKFKSLSEEEKGEWLEGLYGDLKGSLLISDWQAALLIQEVATDEQQTWGGFSDWADRLGVVGTALSGVAATFKAGKLLRGANDLMDVERTLAAAGGKNAIVAAEGAKIVSQAAAKQRMAAAGVIAGEVTGISTAIDLGKLVSMNAAKVLPDAITTAADDLQRIIREPVERLIGELQDVVAAKGIRSSEAAAELEELNRIYSKANNPLVHSVDPFQLTADGTTILGKVLYKPENASAYLTKEAAEAAISALDPSGKAGLKVVPDTTNTGYLVEESVKKDLLLRKAAVEAQILEALAATKVKKAAKGTAPISVDTTKLAAPPKALVTSKPRYKTDELVFENDIDKAAYQVASKSAPSKSDAEVHKWLKEVTGWDDNQIKTHGETIRNYIKNEKYVPRDDQGRVVIATRVPEGRPAHSLLNAHDRASVEQYTTDTTNMTVVGNTYVHSGVSDARYVVEFTQRLGKALGMENRRLVVLQFDAMKTSPNPLHKQLHADLVSRHQSAGAVHYDYYGTSVIVMKKKVGKGVSLREYVETFAHEYGHAFEAEFGTKYFGVMNASFNKWLRAKGLKYQGEGLNKRITDMFPLEAMMEYRSITNADKLSHWIDTWMNGDTVLYKVEEQQFRKWANSYSEFFAENFSRWAFTDEVPTDVLGQAFAKLVNGFKQIAEMVQDILKNAGITGVNVYNADKNIAAMLNQHVKQLKAQVVEGNASLELVAQESKGRKPSVTTLQKELAAIDDELRAINDAETGLKTGWLVEKPVEKKLDYSIIGKYTDDDINSTARFALGDWALSTSSELYAQRVVGINQQSRYVKLLTNFVRPSVEKLNKAEMVALNDILVLGDKEGKVFHPHELAGAGLTPRTREAYYKVRALRDIMHQMRNDVAAKSLIRRGFVQLNTGMKFDDGSGTFFGKETTPEDGRFVYVVSDGTVSRMSETFRNEASNRGLVYYEAVEPILIDGKYRKVFAFTDKSFSTAKIEEVIPYRAGEYRRLYSDEYFVKIASDFDVDGEMKTITNTHRTAATVGEANAYVKAFNEGVALHRAGKLTLAEAARLMQPYGWQPSDFKAALDANKYGDNFKLEVKYNRTDDDYVNETIGLSTNFSSKRGDKIPSVHGGDTVNTLSPLDSIASEISNTAYVASATEWRESHVVRWFNTFSEDLPINVRSMSPEEAFRYMLNNKGHYVGQNKRLQTAEKVQDYIIAQMNIPTKEEKEYLGFMRLISESIEGLAGTNKGVAKFGMALRATKDYPVWARTIAFHSFFAFNPVQFFMQGMNAFNAVAISPLHGLKSAKSSTMYAMALMSDQESIWRTFAKTNKLTNLGLGMDEDEFVEVVRAIRRSGIMDGINSTSMYGAETGKYGLFNGVTRRIGSVAASPFNAGEGYSRLVSFDIARREFMEANKGTAWWTDDAIAKILERQDDLTQNMTQANVANWQTGWKSIPAQFVQYQVKLMMNVVQSLMGNPRAFTQKEALQLLITHTVVMGTAGAFLWPFRDAVTNMLPEDLTETERLTIQQGVVAGMIAAMTDGEAKLALGSRFNTFKYYEDVIKGLLDPQKSFMEVAAGPSGFAGLRILGGVGEGIGIIVKAPLSMATVQAALTEIGRNSFSALNNVQKARIAMANYNQVQSGAGRAMYRVTDTEAWLMGFGITPAAQEDLTIMMESSKAHKKDIADNAKLVSKHAMLALTALRNNDTESHKTHAAVVQAILHSYSGSDLQQLYQEAYKVEAYTQYEKLLIDQAMKDWEVKDITVKGQ